MAESRRYWWRGDDGVPGSPGPFKRRALKWAERFEAKYDPEELLQMKLGLVDTQVRMFGVDGGPTANGRAEVARQLESMGRWVEARVFWEQVVAAYRRNRGADDLMTVQSEEFLALNLAKSDLHQDAINLMDHVVAVYRQALGPDHEQTTRAIRFRERIKALDSE